MKLTRYVILIAFVSVISQSDFKGMDHRAERVVHNSMVNVTCKPDSAQYFLITPKLLTDLEYHERMRILCVNNGEWLPEERNVSGKMMDMIDTYVRMRGDATVH